MTLDQLLGRLNEIRRENPGLGPARVDLLIETKEEGQFQFECEDVAVSLKKSLLGTSVILMSEGV